MSICPCGAPARLTLPDGDAFCAACYRARRPHCTDLAAIERAPLDAREKEHMRRRAWSWLRIMELREYVEEARP